MSNKSDQPILISVTAGGVVKILFVFLAAYLIYMIRDLILVIITSVVIASSIEPGARFLIKRRVPRVVAVILVYLIVIVALIAGFYLFLPTLINDIQNLISSLPEYIDTFSSEEFVLIPGFNNFINTFANSAPASNIFSQITSTVSGATLGLFSTASTVFGGILSFVLIVVISFYLAVQEGGVASFLRIVTPINNEKYVLDLWRRSQEKIALWMQGQLVLGIIVGILTFLGLSILGVPNALFLAVIAAVFELIPIFGPLLSAVPATAFAVIEGGPALGLLTIGLYLIIQQFESQLIHPLVVRKIVGIPALIAILSLIIGAKIAGFLGILIGVPVAAAFMEFIGDIERSKLEESKKAEKNRK